MKVITLDFECNKVVTFIVIDFCCTVIADYFLRLLTKSYNFNSTSSLCVLGIMSQI